MKVKILIEFEVESMENGYDDAELDEKSAKDAASVSAFNHLCMTNNGLDVTDKAVEVHAEGFGHCLVKLGENHE